MVMLYAGLRRGEVLYMDIDRDVDFDKGTIPLVPPLAEALRERHGLLCTKEDGALMSQSAFDRKFDSYKAFLEQKLNGCQKRWYGKKKEHKALLAMGKDLPPWRSITIRCHDFRVDFCTRCYYAGILLKTLQTWMGHSDVQMITEVYSKLTKEQEACDAIKLAVYMSQSVEKSGNSGISA